MEQNKDTSQRGQSLVLVSLMIVALVGMLALVIDGGYGYAKRRAAQVAADAGALAGANVLCTTGVITDSFTAAFDYAINRNGAIEADVNIGGGLVTVTTRIPFQTFFAGVIGQPQVTAAATAVAGCFCPGSGEGVLPIAWSCHPPDFGDPGTGDCAINFGEHPNPGDNPLYIIMDSSDVEGDFICQDPPNSGEPADALDCDLDNDGLNELLASGDRSWLDLTGGGGGAMDLTNWILGGFDSELFIHTWFESQPGNAVSIYKAAKDRIGDIVLLPVFDHFCKGDPALCPDPPPSHNVIPVPLDTIVYGSGASSLYFHVVSFSPFVIYCVEASAAKPDPIIFPDGCPGRNAAELANPEVNWNPLQTIEGYFIKGYVPGLGGRPGTCVDAGAYTIYLLR